MTQKETFDHIMHDAYFNAHDLGEMGKMLRLEYLHNILVRHLGVGIDGKDVDMPDRVIRKIRHENKRPACGVKGCPNHDEEIRVVLPLGVIIPIKQDL